MSLQPLENKALSRGIIGKSAPTLAEITIRKSQVGFFAYPPKEYISVIRRANCDLHMGVVKAPVSNYIIRPPLLLDLIQKAKGIVILLPFFVIGFVRK
jgi:hypothetical protein